MVKFIGIVLLLLWINPAEESAVFFGAPFPEWENPYPGGERSPHYQWPEIECEYPPGTRQSPIDIISSQTTNKQLVELIVHEYDQPFGQAVMTNNGHTVQVQMNEKASLHSFVSGGSLKNKYIFRQMHFHWGENNWFGSEHFINGQSWSFEAHLVHYNSRYRSYEEAANKPDGLAVVALFGKVADYDNPLLKPITDRLPYLVHAGSNATLDTSGAMGWVTTALANNIEYFTYLGSLTTDPFTENVVFIIFPNPFPISAQQLEEFRKTTNETNDPIKENRREIQPINRRTVVRSGFNFRSWWDWDDVY